jgi:AcrR family transcriptional regulator
VRADAARNRERILAVARERFAQDGVDVPLDDIARHAGLGPGTLHRHFPAKQALIAAVVSADLDREIEHGGQLAETGHPGDALFEVLDRLLDAAHANRALKAGLAGEGVDLRAFARGSARRVREVLAILLARAQEAGTARQDLDVDDLLAVLAGAIAAQEAARGSGRQRRVRELALGGLRPFTPG